MAAAARRPAPAASSAPKCKVDSCDGPRAATCCWVHHEKTSEGFESTEGKPCGLKLCPVHAKKIKAGLVCAWHYGVAERKHKEKQEKSVK
jgi:hypothetical protein